MPTPCRLVVLAAFVHHWDAVGVFDCGEAVGDYEAGARTLKHDAEFGLQPGEATFLHGHAPIRMRPAVGS